MKKVLCILLAVLMLALTACQTAPENGDTQKTSGDASGSTESTPEVITPWSELKTLLGNLDPSVQTPSAIQALMSTSEDVKGTGAFSMVMDMSGETMQNVSGNLTIDGDASKTESTVDLMGVQLPMITWTKGETSYVQYPTLYPDNVFRAEDLGDSGSGTMSGMSFSMDLDSLKEQLIALLEENADPDKNMTSAAADGVTTYTINLDAAQAKAFFDGLDAFLEETGLSGLLEMDLMGQLGMGGEEEAPETEEATYDSAVITVSADETGDVNFLMQTFAAEAVADTFLFDLKTEDASVTYTLESKSGEATQFSMTMMMTEEKVTVQADVPSEESAIKLDLELLAESETAVKVDGTLSVTITQGGLSMSIPLTIQGTISADDAGMALEMNMGMEIMGMAMNIAIGYTLTYSDVTLEIPYGEEDVMEYSEEALTEKLMEVYPELFESESNFYVSEDGAIGVSFETETDGMFMTDGTYERNGDYITVTMFGDYNIQGFLSQSGDTYSWNGRQVDVRNIDGIINVVDIVTGAWYWSMFMYEDGTCSITATFSIADDGSVNLASGHTISAEDFLFVDEDTLSVYGVELKK